MIRVKVTAPDGADVVETAVEHHRWRSAIREPRWLAQRHFYVTLGFCAIGDGVAARANAEVAA